MSSTNQHNKDKQVLQMLQSQERVAGLFVDDIRKRQAEMLEAYRKKEAAKKAGEKDR